MTDFAATITCGWIETDDQDTDHHCTLDRWHTGNHHFADPMWCADHGYYRDGYCSLCRHDDITTDGIREGWL